MLNFTRDGNDVAENIEEPRMKKLEDTEEFVSDSWERWNEKIVLNEKSKECDTWVVQLIDCCKEMVMRVEPLKKKCSALTQGLELQNLRLDPLSMTISAEEKSLNNDNFS